MFGSSVDRKCTSTASFITNYMTGLQVHNSHHVKIPFSWNKLYTKEIKITVIFGEKLPGHKWQGKWKFC